MTVALCLPGFVGTLALVVAELPVVLALAGQVVRRHRLGSGVTTLRPTCQGLCVGIAVAPVTLRDSGSVPLDSPAEQQVLLRRRLGDAGWETPAILDAMAQARTFYFDRVSQVRMPSLSRGRVAPWSGEAAASRRCQLGRVPRWR